MSKTTLRILVVVAAAIAIHETALIGRTRASDVTIKFAGQLTAVADPTKKRAHVIADVTLDNGHKFKSLTVKFTDPSGTVVGNFSEGWSVLDTGAPPMPGPDPKKALTYTVYVNYVYQVPVGPGWIDAEVIKSKTISITAPP